VRENNNKTFNYYGNELSKEYKNSRSRIMYIGYKGNGLEGPARIGRVYFSKSGKSIYYKGKCFQYYLNFLIKQTNRYIKLG